MSSAIIEATAQIDLEVPSREKLRMLYTEEQEVSGCQWLLENTNLHPGSGSSKSILKLSAARAKSDSLLPGLLGLSNDPAPQNRWCSFNPLN